MRCTSVAAIFICVAVLGGCNAFTARRLVNPDQNEFFELSIAHINDFHARFVQTSPTSTPCLKGREAQCVGGLSRVLTASRQLKQERPNAIFLNAGDNYQGTLWQAVYHWNASAHFLNELPHDVMNIGNHDFDEGIQGLVPFLKRAKVPVVVANIDDSLEPTIQGQYEKSAVIERSNRKIGVIGVITRDTRIMSNTSKLKFLDEVESVNVEAAKLKAKGVDIIVVLSHTGLNADRVMAAKCPEIDVIVGGHSHSFLYTGKPPFIDVPVDEYPVVVKQNVTNRTVLIVQALAFTKYLGNLTVWFDSEGEVVDWEGNPILLDNKIKQDPELLEELKPWQEAVDAFGKTKVGVTRSYLNSTCRTGECNLANLITDAMVYSFINKTDDPNHWTYASIACMNAGGIRAAIAPGPITFGDLDTVQPFGNTWDVVELKGEDLLEVLEESVSRNWGRGHFESAALLHWSGLRVVYNLSRPVNSRVVEVKVKCQDCSIPKFEDLQKDKTYRVIVPTFILNQGDGLVLIAKKSHNHRIGNLDVSELEKYIRAISPFDYKLDQRLVLNGTCCG